MRVLSEGKKGIVYWRGGITKIPDENPVGPEKYPTSIG